MLKKPIGVIREGIKKLYSAPYAAHHFGPILGTRTDWARPTQPEARKGLDSVGPAWRSSSSRMRERHKWREPNRDATRRKTPSSLTTLPPPPPPGARRVLRPRPVLAKHLRAPFALPPGRYSATYSIALLPSHCCRPSLDSVGDVSMDWGGDGGRSDSPWGGSYSLSSASCDCSCWLRRV
jgi:hypothetical protein